MKVSISIQINFVVHKENQLHQFMEEDVKMAMQQRIAIPFMTTPPTKLCSSNPVQRERFNGFQNFSSNFFKICLLVFVEVL